MQFTRLEKFVIAVMVVTFVMRAFSEEAGTFGTVAATVINAFFLYSYREMFAYFLEFWVKDGEITEA